MSISKIFIPNFVCVLTNIKKIENILNRIFHSVARGGTVGCWGSQNFSVGFCDCAPSTVRSSIILLILCILMVVSGCSSSKTILLNDHYSKSNLVK